LNIRDAIHSIHFSSQEFEDKGNCLSCHAYDATGELVMWDDLKYDKELGGHNYLDVDSVNQKLTEREVPNGSLVDVVWDGDFALSDVRLDQPLSTNEDGSEYTFAAVNMGLRHYEASDWAVNVSGVKGKSSWTLDEIKALPVTEKPFTQDCAGNIQNGVLISTVKATGVSLADFIEACGGLSEGSRSFTVTCKDGWNSFGGVFDIDALIAQEALLAYQYNDHDLTAEQGYPLVMVLPGFGGNYMAKYLETIAFSDAEPTVSSSWTPGFISDGNMNAGWFKPAEDGMEVKVGEEVSLSGWVFEHSSGGHSADKIAFSADYGQNWSYVDVDENLEAYDDDLWITFEGSWVPQSAGTYVLHVRVIDALDPSLTPHDYTDVRFDNYASVIVKVVE
jgi:DMSO/TMAO reductase YedYZ molybdopterin-dependent catalytic subunit